MLTTDRECRRGGQRFAMPTLGEIEGKLIVSEVVAANCLRQLLTTSETEPLPSIKRGIKQALQNRCKGAGLCGEDTDAALEYAFQLLDAAVASVGNQPKQDASGRETVHPMSQMAAPPQ
jgi:hypothetical protein